MVESSQWQFSDPQTRSPAHSADEEHPPSCSLSQVPASAQQVPLSSSGVLLSQGRLQQDLPDSQEQEPVPQTSPGWQSLSEEQEPSSRAQRLEAEQQVSLSPDNCLGSFAKKVQVKERN